MKVTPLQNNVLIKTESQELQKEGSLFIPATNNNGYVRGTVVSVGPGITTTDGRFIEPRVLPGDVVGYIPDTGIEIMIDGARHVVLPEPQLLVKFQ